MDKFTKLSGIAAPLPLINVDTDMIIPKQFLKTIKRSGLGVNLFDEMRFTQDGEEIADFVLNREPYRGAEIIVAGIEKDQARVLVGIDAHALHWFAKLSGSRYQDVVAKVSKKVMPPKTQLV